MSALGVRRGKAAFFSGCKSHPATIAPAGDGWTGRYGAPEGPLKRFIRCCRRSFSFGREDCAFRDQACLHTNERMNGLGVRASC